MGNQRKHLPVLAIPSPCDGDWDEMTGSDTVRRCHHCETDVYNISAMSQDEADAIVNETEKRCIVFAYRGDGTVLSAGESPIRRPRNTRLAVGMAAALAYPAAFAGIRAAVDTDPSAEIAGDEVRVACGIKLVIKPQVKERAPFEAVADQADVGPGYVEATTEASSKTSSSWLFALIAGVLALLGLGRKRWSSDRLDVLDRWSLPQLTAVAAVLTAASASSMAVAVTAGIAAGAAFAASRAIARNR